MKKITTVLALLAILAMVVPVFSQEVEVVKQIGPIVPVLPVEVDGIIVDKKQDLWFVELKSSPAIEGTILSTLKEEKAAFRAAAKKASLTHLFE